MSSISRTPPVSVRRQLRSEVLFGCPVVNCGNPYLEYHHFDPQWNVRNHHEPEGMIALCATHHAKAHAWTREQCSDLKADPHTRDVKGRFEWMRREIVAVVGGTYFHETPNMVVYRDQPVIWFQRDADGYMLLSLNMLTASGQPRARLVANDWELQGTPAQVESPPNGSSLKVHYDNGDLINIRFKEWESTESISSFHPTVLDLGNAVRYPLVTAEIYMVVGGTDLRFDPKSTSIHGNIFSGGLISGGRNGIVIK